ncbi:hypothetical protein JZ751_025053 [Albula glossodonta]|uniref:Uncharacterized protein n=1 Tax=Albula glossodonta TaxID=121402 RepID=A0A8T2PCT1_9TELE|nr:hypothetical protein JZ751_025053 [Albula glossodonta]
MTCKGQQKGPAIIVQSSPEQKALSGRNPQSPASFLWWLVDSQPRTCWPGIQTITQLWPPTGSGASGSCSSSSIFGPWADTGSTSSSSSSLVSFMMMIPPVLVEANDGSGGEGQGQEHPVRLTYMGRDKQQINYSREREGRGENEQENEKQKERV